MSSGKMKEAEAPGEDKDFTSQLPQSGATGRFMGTKLCRRLWRA